MNKSKKLNDLIPFDETMNDEPFQLAVHFSGGIFKCKKKENKLNLNNSII